MRSQPQEPGPARSAFWPEYSQIHRPNQIGFLRSTSRAFRASLLKNSTLRLLNVRVTLIPSSRKTRSSGGGRKSGTTFRRPRGSSVYFIFALIDSLALSPVVRPEDLDHLFTVRE